MTGPFLKRSPSALAIAPLVGALLAGCILPVGNLRTGRPLSADDASRLGREHATKAELFGALGAPTAIAGRGESVEAPAVAVRREVKGDGPGVYDAGGSFPIQGDAMLELFADRAKPGDDHRVYYYSSARESGLFFLFVVFLGSESYRTRVDQLWVLVNERTERVEAAVFRPAG